MPSVIYQKPVCQRDIYQKSPNIFGSSNEKQVHLRSIKLPRIHLFYPCCLCPQPQGHRFSGCRSDLTDMPRAQRVVAPSRYFVPWAALISRWPLPQQLLPASATGRGRRRCPLGELSAKQTERAYSAKYRFALSKQMPRTIFSRAFSSLGYSPSSTHWPMTLQRMRRK